MNNDINYYKYNKYKYKYNKYRNQNGGVDKIIEYKNQNGGGEYNDDYIQDNKIDELHYLELLQYNKYIKDKVMNYEDMTYDELLIIFNNIGITLNTRILIESFMYKYDIYYDEILLYKSIYNKFIYEYEIWPLKIKQLTDPLNPTRNKFIIDVRNIMIQNINDIKQIIEVLLDIIVKKYLPLRNDIMRLPLLIQHIKYISISNNDKKTLIINFIKSYNNLINIIELYKINKLQCDRYI